MRPHPDYARRIYEADSFEDLIDLLAEVTERAKNDFDFLPRASRVAILRDLQSLTETDHINAKAIILGSLLPLCLDKGGIETGMDWDNQTNKKFESRLQEDLWEAHEARELMGNWLAHWVEKDYFELRIEISEQVCEFALNSASSLKDVKAACWTLGEIGWRSPSIENTLLRVFDRDDVAGDVAGGVLVDLGFSTSNQIEFKKKLIVRLRVRPIRYNLYTLIKIADLSLVQDAIDSIFRKSELQWFSGEPLQEDQPRNFSDSMKLAFLAMLCDEIWFSYKTQDRIWKSLFDSCIVTEEGLHDLLFSSNVAPRCDSEFMVGDFLKIPALIFGKDSVDEVERKAAENDAREEFEADDEVFKGDPTHFVLEIAAARLKESVRPYQIDSWRTIEDSQLELFQRLALLDTRQVGYHSTSPMRAKQSMWEILAMGGARWEDSDVETALANESSGFVRGYTAMTIANFPLSVLPETVARGFAFVGNGEGGIHDLDEHEDSSPLINLRGMECIARATANLASFHALLGCNSVFGDLLNSTCDALNEVAVYCHSQGEATISDDLWHAAASSSPRHRRALAISGLHAMAARDLLADSDAQRLLDLSLDNSLDPYYRALTLHAVSFFRSGNVGKEARQTLENIWIDQTDNLPELAKRAHEALARHGTWELFNPDLYLRQIGLEQINNQLRMRHSSAVDAGLMSSLYFLYRAQPDRFKAAICDILTSDINEASYALTFWLLAREPGETLRLNNAVVDAMVTELRKATPMLRSYFFDALEIGAPQRLLDESWKQVTSKFSGSTRLALADAMARAGQGGAICSEETLLTLEILLRDQAFPVRRAAMRALSILAPKVLEHQCRLWSNCATINDRRLAAEALCWGDAEAENQFQRALDCDVEPSVRKIARKSRMTRRDRLWADGYMTQIEKAIFRASKKASDLDYGFYAAGVALQKLGDDFHLRHLNRLETQKLHLHWKVWQEQTLEKLKKRWQEVTRDWHEVSEGVISWEGSAVLNRPNTEPLEARVWMWLQPSKGIRLSSSWGGKISFQNPQRVFHLDMEDDPVLLVMEDGRKGEILLQNIDVVYGKNENSWVSFIGTGPLTLPD